MLDGTLLLVERADKALLGSSGFDPALELADGSRQAVDPESDLFLVESGLEHCLEPFFTGLAPR